MNKVVLAFSGGLDTSVCVKYLQSLHNLDVITLTVDVGQNDDFKDINKVSADLGAVEHVYVDAKQEFLNDYVTPAIQANALYQQKYPLATAIARPLIAKKAVEVAREHNANAISHGCTGKGNDQVRFDIAIRSLNPNLNIIAPIRDMNLTRDKELEYANENNIKISAVAKKYSIDENLWGRAIEGGSLENLENEPPDDAFKFVKQNNTSAGYVSIGFERGVPISIDGTRMELGLLVKKLNDVAGAFGVGIIDHIEDRVVGIKSREVYEAPAALVLVEAHKDLEKLVLTHNELRFKFSVDDQWAWLAYSGLWLDPLLTDLNAFIAKTQERVTGEIKIKMHNGSYRVVGRKSTFSLYDNDAITYMSNSNFDQRLASGFVTLWGLQSSAANKMISKNKA
ncbi:MAG: argininosuccinate synthase [Candidatus Nitrosocosmicus sp.]|jgi:argininosuccinate synthase|uniref:argininosuccinate synthase n=1 Tax=Candidatus Nitrosocosmicus sp. FF01 TaxID=3397670 RepID=UPI002A6BEF6D|nr:argininosuccinate synthase [Candidatus Nitrosocosmicus sp.]GKS60951.1 argininosuccinate synthase [Candidatus Nitrosocosmicus sp.]